MQGKVIKKTVPNEPIVRKKPKEETINNEIIKDKEVIDKCLKSKDFFLVRNYMKKYKLISGLSKEELIDIKNTFEDYIDCLDMDGILNNYLFVSLSCIVCKTDFSSVYDVLEHKNCINAKYHPPCGQMENCQHKGCQKRFKKGEYNCCHKKLNEKDELIKKLNEIVINQEKRINNNENEIKELKEKNEKLFIENKNNIDKINSKLSNQEKEVAKLIKINKKNMAFY